MQSERFLRINERRLAPESISSALDLLNLNQLNRLIVEFRGTRLSNRRAESQVLFHVVITIKMVARLFAFLLTIGTGFGDQSRHAPVCKYIPGDAGWPSHKAWQGLNTTVAGRLIATVPIAHVCHDRGEFSAYNETACAELGQAIQVAGAKTLYVMHT